MVWHKWDPVCSPPRGLVRPVPVDPLGVVGPTRGQAQGPTWRTTSRGLFVPASVDLSVPEQRILEESMRLPSTGAVTGWGACRLHGANYCDGLGGDGLTPLPVPLAVGPGFTIRHDSGVRVSHDRLPAADVLVRQGIPTVRATRGVFDMMRFAPGVRAAVAGLDMAVAARITSIERVAVWTTQHPGCTGIDQVRLALPLAR
ncbi:MAG: hypothetical protein L0H93_01195, partial [Nocardioides sp.]|nr:hypothetical protein [Nocardioides sp.]